MTDYTRPGDRVYEQDVEPVTPPPGFGSPRFQIGDRVVVAFTTMAPQYLRSHEGAVGTVCQVVFCKSDGKTILYGVQYDTPTADRATGSRWEGFELDKL